MKRLALLGLGVILGASPLAAQTLLFDNFNSENGGNSQLNYFGFANWLVATGRQVDLVKSGDFGITCPGSCVDMDGSSGPGTITTLNSFSFASGDIMKFTFDISGSQRSSAADDITLSLLFNGTYNITSYLGTGGFSSSGGPFTVGGIGVTTSIFGTTPFSTWSFQFEAGQSGSLFYALSTSSADAVGPLVDNIHIERVVPTSVVPEPSTWVMLAFGMGVLGVVSKRRVRQS